MRRIYRWLIRLYPRGFREEFGAEMAGVFEEAWTEARAGRARTALLAHECVGLIRGAVQERLHAAMIEAWFSRRCTMTGHRFRFPLPGIAFMAISLALVLTAIRAARGIAQALAGKTYVFEGHTYMFYRPDNLSFLQTFGFVFGLTVACTLLILAVMYALRRAGVHRLAEAKTWPVQQ